MLLRYLLACDVERERGELVLAEATKEGEREVVDADVRRAVEQPARRVARLGHLLRDLRIFNHGRLAVGEGDHTNRLVRVAFGHRLRRAVGVSALRHDVPIGNGATDH